MPRRSARRRSSRRGSRRRASHGARRMHSRSSRRGSRSARRRAGRYHFRAASVEDTKRQWTVLENDNLKSSTCKIRALGTNQPHKIGQDQFGLIDHIITNLEGRMLTEFDCPNDGKGITDYTRLLPNYTPNGDIEFIDPKNTKSTSDHVPLIAVVQLPNGVPVKLMQMNLLGNLVSGDGFLKGSISPERKDDIRRALQDFNAELAQSYPTTNQRKNLGLNVDRWNETKAELFTRLHLDEAIRNEIENHSLTDAVMTRDAFDERAGVLINSILRIKPDIIAFQENDMEPIFHYKKEFADLYTNSFVYEHAHLEKKLSNGKMNNIKRENELGSYFVGDGVSIYVRKERFEIVSVCKAFTSQQNPILHVVVKDVLDQNHLYNVITTHLSSGDNETDHRMRTTDLKELGEYIRNIDQKENIVLMMDANENVKKRKWLPDVVGE